jgi:hypothetical protein
VLPQLRAATPKMPDPEKIAARAARFQTTVSGEKAATYSTTFMLE